MKRPVHIARAGDILVPVLRNGPGRYAVQWRPVAGEKPRRERFRDRDAAIRRANEIAVGILRGRADVLELTNADRDSYRLATKLLAPFGIPLHAAAEEYAAARRKLGTHTIAEAVAVFTRTTATGDCPPTREIVDAILADLRGDPIRPRTDAYLRTIKPRLLAIATAFPTLADATPETVPAFLRALRHKGRPISAKTYNHFRSAFALVWTRARHLAEARSFPLGPDPLRGVQRLDAPGQREVYTMAELRALLAHADAKWIPFIVLGAFAGLRPCEAARLSWQDIIWEQGEIRITAAIAGKRGSPRNVPINDTLAAWLAPHRTRLGRIYPTTERRLFNQLRRFIARIEKHAEGFRWKANALRHSFGSHHVATHRNLELTRTIMGTGMAMLRHHYNAPQFRNDAEAYWKLLPSTARPNVVEMPAASQSK